MFFYTYISSIQICFWSHTTKTRWLFDRGAVYSEMSIKKSCVQSSVMVFKTLLSIDTPSDSILIIQIETHIPDFQHGSLRINLRASLTSRSYS